MSKILSQYIGRTHEQEFKADLGASFAHAADRAAFLSAFSNDIRDVRFKGKRRIIVDTPQLDLRRAGFDLILGITQHGKLKQRFKSHSVPDRLGIMSRIEDEAQLEPHKHGGILPDLKALKSPSDRRKLAHINPEDLRAIGVLHYRSTYARLQVYGFEGVDMKLDHVRTRPLFSGVSAHVLDEVELDTEDRDYTVLQDMVGELREAFAELVPIRESKVQQVLRAWRPSIPLAAGDLPRPAMRLFD